MEIQGVRLSDVLKVLFAKFVMFHTFWDGTKIISWGNSSLGGVKIREVQRKKLKFVGSNFSFVTIHYNMLD